MDFIRTATTVLVLCVVLVCASHNQQDTPTASSSSALNVLGKVYGQCENADEMVKCLKVQAIKLAARAIRVPTIQLVDGVSVIKRKGYRDSRSMVDNELNGLQQMSSDKIDGLLWSAAQQLMESHQLQVNVPRLITYGQREVSAFVEEGRKKKRKYLGPFLAAVALKAGILKMAYHSIAIVAGKALIIGKIALVISAIIGLKKLVAPEGHEKTTYEIVKHPHVQQSHSYSSSNGEFEGHGGGGGGGEQYHRSLGDGSSGGGGGGGDDETMLMQDRIYKAQKPLN